MYIQDWEYNRDELTYLRDIGEGQFGKVLLMRAKVESLILIGLPCLTVVHWFVLWVLGQACGEEPSWFKLVLLRCNDSLHKKISKKKSS